MPWVIMTITMIIMIMFRDALGSEGWREFKWLAKGCGGAEMEPSWTEAEETAKQQPGRNTRGLNLSNALLTHFTIPGAQ